MADSRTPVSGVSHSAEQSEHIGCTWVIGRHGMKILEDTLGANITRGSEKAGCEGAILSPVSRLFQKGAVQKARETLADVLPGG